jgi:uncharacterized protein (TIGR02391 family)
MPKRHSPPESANLTPEEINRAIERLSKRIEELKAVDVARMTPNDLSELNALEDKVRATLTDIFPVGTIDYHHFGNIRLDKSPFSMGRQLPFEVVRRGWAAGIKDALSTLRTITELLEEKLGPEQGDPASRARRVMGDLDLHPEIARAATKLFENGHYANATEDACKVLDQLVKMRSGSEKSGTDLMLEVFSPNKPVLRFSGLKTETEQSEQRGLMFLYAGAMLALRNPRAHEILEDQPERAAEYIAFVSLLAKLLDRAERG